MFRREAVTCTRLASLLTAMMLVACQAMPHRDNILFGTQTNFGISIEKSPETGNTPEFNVGYRRSEFVNMPLLVNGADSRVCERSTSQSACGEVSIGDAMYTSTSGPDSQKGPRKDTYSVFASFGAKFGSGENSTEGGLAQFFATGIAAQALGENANVTRALAIRESSADHLEAANDALSVALSDAERALITNRATDEAIKLSDRLRAVVAIASPDGSFDKSKWDAAVEKLSGDYWSGYRTILKSYSSSAEIMANAPYEAGPAVAALFEANTSTK